MEISPPASSEHAKFWPSGPREKRRLLILLVPALFLALVLILNQLPDQSSGALLVPRPAGTQATALATPANLPARVRENEPPLELVSFTWRNESPFVIVEGEVTNISSEALHHVEAVAIFRDSSGTFITSDDAIIEYDPILPGQTSPFTVTARWNPAMKGVNIDFKKFNGGTIAFRLNKKSSDK